MASLYKINKGLRLKAQASAPASPQDGSIYYDSGLGLFRFRQSGVWSEIPTGAFNNGGNSFGGNATLGTNDNYNLNFETNNTTRLIIDTSGRIGINTINSSAMVNLSVNNLTGTDQRAFNLETGSFEINSAATSIGRGFSGVFGTSAAAFTCAALSGFYINLTAGAGSTITRAIGFNGNGFFTNVGSGTTTNRALLADNQNFSGNYVINSTSTNPSLFSGNLRVRLDGNTGSISGTGTEAVSALGYNTGTPSATTFGVYGRSQVNSTSNLTSAIHGVRGDFYRQVASGTNVSETCQIIGGIFRGTIDVGAANTYTNTGTVVSAIQIGALTNTNSSTLAIGNYCGIFFGADNVATGTRKTAIQLSSWGGATNNAQIADNTGYVGNYFIHSTSTNPTVFGNANFDIGTTGNVNTFTVYGKIFGQHTGNIDWDFRTSGTSSSHNSTIAVAVGGTTGGDPGIRFDIPSGTSWVFGTDNSDSDILKVSQGSVLGTSDYLRFNSSGGLPYLITPGRIEAQQTANFGSGSVSPLSIVNVSGNTPSLITGDRQWAYTAAHSVNSSATHSSLAAIGYYSGITTQAASFTAPVRFQFHADNIAKGAGSTITRDIHFYSASGPNQGTNNATIADNIGFTGSWFINSSSSNPSLLRSRLTLGAGDSPNVALQVDVGTLNGALTGSAQYGISSAGAYPTSATSEVKAFWANPALIAGSWTTAVAASYYSHGLTLGASSAATRYSHFLGTNSAPATHNAFIADNVGFTGNWFIHQSNSFDSHFRPNSLFEIITTTAGLLDFQGPGSAAGHSIRAYNTSNTGSSAAFLTAQVGGTSSGDPALRLRIDSGADWIIGSDNSTANDPLCIQNASLIDSGAGGTNWLTLTPSTGSAVFGFGSSSSPIQSFTVFSSTSGNTSYTFRNVNGGTGSGANVYIQTGPSVTTGDPSISFDNNSATFSAGIDTSDTNKWKLSRSSSLGTNDAIVVESSANSVAIKGTTTNDSAASGFVGEAQRAAVTSATNVTTTNTWQNVTSISLTAGDWDVTGQVNFLLNGATCTVVQAAVSVNSGTGTGDHVDGDNVLSGLPPTSAARNSYTISAYRLSLSATTTVYLKAFATFSAGNPQYVGRISARRAR